MHFHTVYNISQSFFAVLLTQYYPMEGVIVSYITLPLYWFTVINECSSFKFCLVELGFIHQKLKHKQNRTVQMKFKIFTIKGHRQGFYQN